MSISPQTDTFFFTRFSATDRPIEPIQKVSSSLSRPIQQRRTQIQSMYDNYNLFKYSKCFTNRRKYSVKNLREAEKVNPNHNYKTIQRQSEKLKERLITMEKDRRVLLEKLKLQQK